MERQARAVPELADPSAQARRHHPRFARMTSCFLFVRLSIASTWPQRNCWGLLTVPRDRGAAVDQGANSVQRPVCMGPHPLVEPACLGPGRLCLTNCAIKMPNFVSVSGRPPAAIE